MMDTKQSYHTIKSDAIPFSTHAEELTLQRFDTVKATVIQTTRKGVILSFCGGWQGFAYGCYEVNSVVWASIQRVQEGRTPRLSVDSVIFYPAA